jgi:hypothetical protein
MRVLTRLKFSTRIATAVVLPSVLIAQSANTTVKAIVAHEYGGPDVFFAVIVATFAR